MKMNELNEKSMVQIFFEKNGRFPTDEETFDLIDDKVNEFRDKRFMRRVSEMFDKEYPGRIHCAWMIGTLSSRYDDPVIVHSSNIVDTLELLNLSHNVYVLTGMDTEVYTQSLLKAVQNPVAAALAGKYTPVLFYKREGANEPEIRKNRFSDELPEDPTDLLRTVISADDDQNSGNTENRFDSMWDGFFKASHASDSSID